ncbi:MAG: hypothetical protein IJF61_02580 [Clostridia bacterium]|nr:hypothetical protein [Clostridia bacterium]
MNTLQVGFATVNINPPLGIPVCGYFVKRYARGFLDDLEVSAMALACNESSVVLISVDICYFENDFANKIRASVAEVIGMPLENIFLSATHTHTGPGSILDKNEGNDLTASYNSFLENRICDVVRLALLDLKPAKMGYIVGYAPERVAYIRRYKMKDGSTMTCPPVGSPEIEGPIGELDQRVNVLRFDRDGGKSIVIVNYGVHADTVNGDMISSDWPGWMRRTLDKALDGVKSMFIAGCEGDVGSTNVFPRDGDMNDTEISFDNEMKSPGMARFVGRAIAGTVLQVYDKVKYIDVNKISVLHKIAKIPSNMPKAEEMPLARRYMDLHKAGKENEIPFEAMELTTVVAEAERMCLLENGPEYFDMDFMGIKLGEVAIVGIPGEPFTEVGVGIKDTDGWGIIMPCALVNGSMGYFPMMSAYNEGGYEARSTRFKAGVGERIIENSKAVLDEMVKM